MSYEDLFFPVLKRRKTYGAKVHYRHYRQEIREDCLGRCVFCDAHENELGGAEQMQIDHLRPKSFPAYKSLEHDPTNLLWACRTCNNKKDSAWPAHGTPNTFVAVGGFLDPFAVNRRDYFRVAKDGNLVPLQNPARYMIRLLALNRSFAKSKREKRISNYILLQTLETKKKERVQEIEKFELRLREGKLNADELRIAELCREEVLVIEAALPGLQFDTRLY